MTVNLRSYLQPAVLQQLVSSSRETFQHSKHSTAQQAAQSARMVRLQDLSAVMTGLYDQPLLGPKPDQLLIFKRPQLAIKLQGLLQPATSAAAKHSNLSVVNQAIAAMYEHPALHDHVAGWAPVRSGQHNAEVHLSFRDASAQHRQQLASAGTIQLLMHGAAAPVSLPVSTVASKQLPDVTMVRMHNVPGGINVHGLMGCLLKHFQFGPEYTVVAEYGGDASGDIAAAIPTWCRSDVCIAELRAPVSDAKLSRLPSAFTCFGQQVSVSVQPSILAKAHLYQLKVQSQMQQPTGSAPASSLPPRTKRRQQQRARAQKAASRQALQQQQQQQQRQQHQAAHAAFRPAATDDNVPSADRLVLGRPLDPVLDLGGQRGRAGLGHSTPSPMSLDPQQGSDQVSSDSLPASVATPEACPTPMQVTASPSASAAVASAAHAAPAPEPQLVDAPMLPALPLPLPADFPDTTVSSAMCLWAEEVDIAIDIARQAVVHVHANFATELSQHPSADHICLPKPLQALMVRAIGAITGDAPLHLLGSSDTQSDSSEAAPASTAAGSPAQPSTTATATETTPRRSGRQHTPATEYWKVPPAAPGGAQ